MMSCNTIKTAHDMIPFDQPQHTAGINLPGIQSACTENDTDRRCSCPAGSDGICQTCLYPTHCLVRQEHVRAGTPAAKTEECEARQARDTP